MPEGLFDKRFSEVKRFFVGREQVVKALGESFFEALQHAFDFHHRASLEECSEHKHIECFAALEVESGFHGVDTMYGDIGASGLAMYAVRVVDKHTAGFHFAFEFVEALLVEHHGRSEEHTSELQSQR